MKKKGVSLIELLVVLSLMLIVMGTVSNFFFNNYHKVKTVIGEINLQQEGERALNTIFEDIITANNIQDIEEIHKAGTLCTASFVLTYTDGKVIKYMIEDNALKKSEDRINYVTKARNIYYMQIKKKNSSEGNSFVDIVITLTNDGSTVDKSLETKAYFRNR